MNNPLVSIIVPTYKRAEMLPRAIKSLLKQTYRNIQIIVVDDNNENDEFRKKTELVMKEFENNEKVIYIKNIKNLGGGGARNVGIEISTGEFITFLDDDDEFLETKIEKQYNNFKKSTLENLAFVYCQMSYYNENGFFKGTRTVRERGNKEPLKYHCIYNLTGLPALFVKKEILIEVGGFKNLKAFQDAELILNILGKKYNIDYLEESLVKVYEHNNIRISKSNNKVQAIMEYYNIKAMYMLGLEKNSRDLINNRYYTDLSLEYSKCDIKKSINYLLKAIKIIKFRRTYLKVIINIFYSGKPNLKNYILK